MEINLATDLRPYESDAEFLLDQLQLLDERINLYLARKNRRLDIDGKNFYRGLVLSEKEFSELMAENNFDEELKLQINQMESQVLLGEVYIQRRVALTAEYGSELKTNKVLNKFNLGNFEKQCVFIALAVELDSKYEKVFAYLQNDVERRNPTIGLVLELLSKSKEEQLRNRSFFAEDAKLMKYFFAPGEDKNLPSFLTRALKLNPDMVNYLLEWEPSPTVGSPPTPLLYNQEILDNITTILAREKQVIICLEGKHGTGKNLIVNHIAHKQGSTVCLVDFREMQFSDEVYIQQFLKCLRQAIIKEQILCLDYFEVIFQDEDYLRKINKILELTEDFKGTVFILSEASTRGIIKAHKKSAALFLDIPDGLTRKTLWDYYTAQLAGQLEIQVDLNVIANKYLLTPKQIRNAAQDLNNIVLSKKGSKAVTEEDINQACLNQILSKLSEKGTKIKPFYTFDDIVIEDNQRRMLMDICNRVKYKHKVYEEWGFNKKIPYGRGLTVLFSGPPGTGKTMSSEVIANEIGLELYKVEVPQIISKYVGETEKNLKEIFSEAKNSNAILFFDEADAIFGKRSEVKSSQDRYANIEVAYLLQEMEAYEGITILATNLQENIDEAFFRRIQFHVQFTMPDRELRKKIWLKLIPPEAPLADDIDFDFLAQKYELSGGNIKNIVVSSAFQAAATNSKISMKLILNAVKDELQKNGKIFTKEDFGEYSFLVYN